jgi:hypothetical protein
LGFSPNFKQFVRSNLQTVRINHSSGAIFSQNGHFLQQIKANPPKPQQKPTTPSEVHEVDRTVGRSLSPTNQNQAHTQHFSFAKMGCGRFGSVFQSKPIVSVKIAPAKKLFFDHFHHFHHFQEFEQIIDFCRANL